MAYSWDRERRERKKRAPRVFVSDAKVHDDGYTIYKIISKVLDESDLTSIQSFEYYKETVVWKRYSDIKALHNLLASLHKKLYLEGTVPPFAKAKVFGRFDTQVIEERRKSAQDLFDFVLLHPPLYRSNFFHNFFKGSKVVKRSEEISKLKQKPLCPKDATDTVTNDVTDENNRKDDNNSALTQADLQTFDPFYTKEFLSSTSVNQDNDWLNEIKREISPTEESSKDPAQPDVNIIKEDEDLMEELKITASEKEMAEFYDKKKNGETDEVARQQLLSTHPDNFANLNDVREQHRKSSKASAYLNQVLKDVSSSDKTDSAHDTVGVTNQTLDSNVLSKEESPAPMTISASNKDSLLSASGSLADIWKYLKDEDDDDKRGAYIMQANQQISYARKAELREAYEEAFGHYKTAINTLLQGVQDDLDEQRIQAVRRKTAIYLKRAEDIYNEHLENKCDEYEHKSKWQPIESPPSSNNTTQHEFKSASPKPLPYAFSSRKGRGTSSPIPPIPSPRHTSADLSCYKVIGTVGKVLLVVDNQINQTFVMKVIAKSCKIRQSKGVIPTNVPFMVRLYRYYSTDAAICLLLEYAQGGKLWDHLSSYFKRNSSQHKKGAGSMKRSRTFTSDNHENSLKKLSVGSASDLPKSDSTASVKSSRIKRTESILSWDSPQIDVPETTTPGENSDDTRYEVSTINYNEIASSADHMLFTVGDDEEKSDDGSFCSDISEEGPPRDLLSEQDMSAVYICSDEKSNLPIPQNERNKNIKDILSSSPRNLSPGPASPCLSVNSSFETSTDKYINPTTTSTPVVSRLVDENGVSSVDAISLFRAHSRTKSIEVNMKNIENSLPTPQDTEHDNAFQSSTTSQKQVHSIFEEMDDASAKSSNFHLPEETIKLWAAEMVIAVGTLHSVGILCRDLNPDNLLLSQDGHIRLSYFGKWRQVERKSHCEKALAGMYAAPECCGVIEKKTEACDWWSVGAIVYEIMTGESVQCTYPSGINSHTVLELPDHLSAEAKSFLKGLLQCNPCERLGYGSKNLDDIMGHPFFEGIEWDKLIEMHSGS